MTLTSRSRAGSAKTRRVAARLRASASGRGASRTETQHSSIWAISFMKDILTGVDTSVNNPVPGCREDRVPGRGSPQGEWSFMRDMPEVLFVCVHNAGRSQMAAGLLEHYAQSRVRIRSAGSTA